MYNPDIDVDILVNGNPVKKYSHKNKTFIESKHWTEYAIRIRNKSVQRRLVIVSCDGINVIDGQAAGATKAGYVINGYGSLEIKGFRTSNEVVHPFRFNSQEQSYAAKSEVTNGDTTNCGVIGVEVYSEKEIPFPPTSIVWNYHHNVYPIKYDIDLTPSFPHNPVYTCSLNNMGGDSVGRGITNTSCSIRGSSSNVFGEKICSSRNREPEVPTEITRGFDMGTEFSDKEVADKVVDVEFEIGHLIRTVSVYYASRAGLSSMGVPLTRQSQIAMPNPFPSKFCQPPRK